MDIYVLDLMGSNRTFMELKYENIAQTLSLRTF